MTAQWDKRIQRARDLAAQYPAAAELLSFYSEIAAFQKDIYEAAARAGMTPVPFRPLVEQFTSLLVSSQFPLLLEVVEKKGPAELARTAHELKQNPEQWDALLGTQANGQDASRSFLVRACMQPFAEYLISRSNAQWAGYGGSLCPICNSKPQLGVLRPEGDSGKRSLVCSLCLCEWDFGRIRCPACGEQDHKNLPRFSAAEEFPHVYVEACDTCKEYLKTVDLTVNGLAVPLVDEIAAASLDLWATDHAYRKIELNLVGL